MEVVLACNYLEDNEGTFIKELGVARLSETGCNNIGHYIFKPRTPYNELSLEKKSKNQNLINFNHGLKYDGGQIEYTELPHILKKIAGRATAMYCYSLTDSHILSKVCQFTFIPLQSNFSAPPPDALAVPGISCMLACHMIPGFTCALRSATILSHWLKSHKTKILSERLCSLPPSDSIEQKDTC